MNFMDIVRTYCINQYLSDPKICSLLVVQIEPSLGMPNRDIDKVILLVYYDEIEKNGALNHYIQGNEHVQEYGYSIKELERHICVSEESPCLVNWIIKGDLVKDEDDYIETIRNKINQMPIRLQKQKLQHEFSRFLKCYLNCKQSMDTNQPFDAYRHISDALYKWARMAMIEQGKLPVSDVWGQVKSINPGIYKLYEELTDSPETIEQRIELILLALEFSVLSRIKEYCHDLLEIMGTRKEPWTEDELYEAMEIQREDLDLGLILHKLQKLNHIHMVVQDEGYYSDIKYSL